MVGIVLRFGFVIVCIACVVLDFGWCVVIWWLT